MKTIHIDEGIHQKLAIQSIIEEKTIIKLVEELIEEYLKKVNFKMP